MKVAIIGGGAAGFFAAIHVKINFPDSTVTIYEKSAKLLAKVKVSGGGRCNVTNGESDIVALINAYPRGGKQLRRAFKKFKTSDTIKWFEERGVPLMIQADNCVFPVSQDSQSIIDCFLKEAQKKEISIQTNTAVFKILPRNNEQLRLFFDKDLTDYSDFDKVIVTTGGSPKLSGLDWLAELGHEMEVPVPSLFTFNMPTEKVKELMGIVVEETVTTVQGTKLKSNGPLLITHWGMSGPSILKLSAFGARILSEKNYEFNVQVNWVNVQDNNVVHLELMKIEEEHGNKILANIRPYFLPERLWHFLLDKAALPANKKWNEMGKKGRNKLVSLLTNDVYAVNGKTTFKEEFVTCGGVSLSSIDVDTMESLVCPNLYFAGEVLDIDGITGGYNFQAAWTTAFIASKLSI